MLELAAKLSNAEGCHDQQSSACSTASAAAVLLKSTAAPLAAAAELARAASAPLCSGEHPVSWSSGSRGPPGMDHGLPGPGVPAPWAEPGALMARHVGLKGCRPPARGTPTPLSVSAPSRRGPAPAPHFSLPIAVFIWSSKTLTTIAMPLWPIHRRQIPMKPYADQHWASRSDV